MYLAQRCSTFPLLQHFDDIDMDNGSLHDDSDGEDEAPPGAVANAPDDSGSDDESSSDVDEIVFSNTNWNQVSPVGHA